MLIGKCNLMIKLFVMKKIFIPIFLIFFAVSSNAQVIDFTMTATDGTTYNLFDQLDQGKTIVLDFFSTTCGTCQLSVPTLEHAWNEYLENGTYGYVWSVEAAYRPNEAIDEFLNEFGGTFPGFSIINDDSIVNDTFGYHVPYTPYFYMICPNYKIHNFSIDELDQFLANCGIEVGLEDKIWKHTKIYTHNNHLKFIDLPFEHQKHNVQIIDITGKQILSKNVFETSGEIRLPENLNGIFLVRVTNNIEHFSTKIIIE
jgi:thiol-disulfide isomerase/thioredoxin